MTRAKFKLEGKHGKAWGKLFWKGARSFESLWMYRIVLIRARCAGRNVTKGQDERIRGALKYTWVEGVSTPPKVATAGQSPDHH